MKIKFSLSDKDTLPMFTWSDLHHFNNPILFEVPHKKENDDV